MENNECNREREIVKGKIYKLRIGASVVIRGTGSLGGLTFATVEKTYVMVTFVGKDFSGRYIYLEGYFVEPNSYGMLEFKETEIQFYEKDVVDGPFEVEYMTRYPELGIFEPEPQNNI